MLARLSVLLLIWLWLPVVLAAARLEVEVTPKNKVVQENIQAYIGSVQDYDADSLQRYRRTALHLARQATEALGYYQARYQARIIHSKTPVLQMQIALGEPVLLRQVDIQIQGDAHTLEAFQVDRDKRLQAGEILHQGAYEAAKGQLQQQALRHGFFAAHFVRQRIVVDPQAGTADIELHFDSGPRYLLGKVVFLPHSGIDEQLLQKMVPFAPGTPYHSTHLAKLSQNLHATGYFEQVQVDAVGEADGPRTIDVQVSLQPAKPRTFGVGAGFSTDIGPRARFTWEQQRINEQGHKLGLASEWSKPKQNITGWYSIPLSAPLTDQLRFVGGYQHEAFVDARSRRFALGGQWHKQVQSDWQRIIGLRWEQERYDYGRIQPLRSSEFLMPSISFTKLHSDSPLDPSVGYRLQTDISVAKQDMAADADLLHVTALANGLMTLAEKHRILVRTQIGGIATNDYGRIPPSLRFFAGGDQSVRGYDYQNLSPRDLYRNRIGGRYLLAQSLEYQYSIRDRWRVATFTDRGNAVDSWTDAMKASVGIGVRWVSPIGPLRLDFAHALHDDRGWRIHFSMGPEL